MGFAEDEASVIVTESFRSEGNLDQQAEFDSAPSDPSAEPSPIANRQFHRIGGATIENRLKPRTKGMTAEHFEIAIDALMAQRPFKPFTIELNTGERFEIDGHGILLWKGGAPAVFKVPGGPLAFFDHDSVNKITDDLASATP
jgi:hypothetical protein